MLVCMKPLQAQFISEIIEYKPAPGQFINTSAWGMPSSAQSLVGSMSGALSLGAFGGYVVFKFDNPVENHTDNPYGMDFVIYGNPLKNLSTPNLNNNVTWAEPGIVSVMKDENENGLPDDTWYELAGCDYFFSTTQKNYEVTYTNPGGTTATDVPWTDNQSDSGFVFANSFHSQAYYPLPENFSNVDTSQYTLRGTRIKDFVDRTNPSYITAAGRLWGYVDNNLRNTYNGYPDNPYTDNVEEGSGGDAFDISWAVDADGNYVDLNEINFVKVHNATLADAGWLGEVSTEITGAFDVAPDASYSEWDSTSLVLNNIPILVSVGANYQLEAAFFVKGRKINIDNIEWAATPESKVSIDENNLLATVDTGNVTITASCTYAGNTYSTSMITTIIAPAAIEIVFDQTEIQVGQKYLIKAVVKDQNEGELSGLTNVWEPSNDNVQVIEENDSSYLAGVKTGTSTIYVYPAGYPDIRDSIEVTILEAADSIAAFLTIKTNTHTFVPKTKIELSNFELTPFISESNHNYGLSDVPNVTAAHAVASIFENVSFESDLRFKDTEENGLYLYKLPVSSGSQIKYYYGYGNSDVDKSCWMINIGDNTYFNNLEDVVLFENDNLVAYYVEDITANWNLYNLTGSETAINVGASIDITLMQETFYLYSETTVINEGISPAANIAVYINGEVLMEGGDTIKTNNEGKATLIFNEPSSYTIAAATEQINLVVNNSTDIQEKTTKDFTVYPNPANERFSIAFPFSKNEIIDLKIFSATGRLVYQNKYHSSNSLININTTSWSNGLYIIQIESYSGRVVKKMMINH